MDLYKIFVKRIGLIGFVNILVSISSIVLIPILTKNLSVNNYGIWVQFNTVIGLTLNFATLGLPFTMVRFIAPLTDRKKMQNVFYTITFIVIISTLIISLLLLLFSNFISINLLSGNLEIALILPLAMFITCLNSHFLNFFRAVLQIKKYSIFLLLQSYLILIFVYLLILTSNNIADAVIGYLISQLIVLSIMLPFIFHQIGFKIPTFQKIKEYLSFGLPTVPGNLSYWIVDSSDRFIIGLFLGTAFVGYYSPGYSLGNVILMFFAPFFLLLPSILSNHYDKGEINHVKTFLKYSLNVSLIITIPAVLILSILSKPILMILATPEIASYGYLVTPFVAVSALLGGIQGIIAHIFVISKDTRKMGFIWILAAAINIILNLIFVPYLGIIGAAAMTLAAYTFAFIATVYYSTKSFSFDFELGFIGKIIIASLIISLIIILINPTGLLEITITVGFNILAYLVILWVLNVISKEELRFLKKLFQTS